MNFTGRIKWFLQAASHYVTMWIAYRYAKDFPQYFVVGFPRSGTSWLSEMVADYYNLPRPRHYYLPIAFAAVLHTHFKPNRKFVNTFYVYRDGRDSYASSYFKSLRLIQEDPGFVRTDHYRKIFIGDLSNLSPEEHRQNFFAFLKDEHRRGYVWSEHIAEWQTAAQSNPGIVLLSFEGLLRNAVDELGAAIARISGTADPQVLEQVVCKNSFAQQIRRPQEQHRTVLRKGKKNSWRECFSRESAQVFHESCGAKLVELGYEQDSNWGKELPSLRSTES